MLKIYPFLMFRMMGGILMPIYYWCYCSNICPNVIGVCFRNFSCSVTFILFYIILKYSSSGNLHFELLICVCLLMHRKYSSPVVQQMGISKTHHQRENPPHFTFPTLNFQSNVEVIWRWSKLRPKCEWRKIGEMLRKFKNPFKSTEEK